MVIKKIHTKTIIELDLSLQKLAAHLEKAFAIFFSHLSISILVQLQKHLGDKFTSCFSNQTSV